MFGDRPGEVPFLRDCPAVLGKASPRMGGHSMGGCGFGRGCAWPNGIIPREPIQTG